MINDESHEVIDELFKSLKNWYQNNLESIKGRAFLFNYAYLLYYKCHKINSNIGKSYFDFPDWIKKATINPINKKGNKCYQYAVTVVLNHKNIGKIPKIITKIKPFVNKYKWEEKNCPSKKDDWKNFEKNNVTIAINVLYVQKEKYIPLMFQNITKVVKNKLFF